MSNRIMDCVSDIEKIFCTKMSTNSDVLSIFSIGSMSKCDYRIRNENDYDIRIYASKVNDALMADIQETLESCITFVSQHYPWLAISYSDVIGPARFISKDSRPSLLIHCILLTKESFNNLPIMHRISYSKQYAILYGSDFIHEGLTLRLTIGGILHDTEGLYYCLYHLTHKEISYLKWVKQSNGYSVVEKTLPFTPDTAFEFVRYSVEKTTNNLIAYFEQEHMADALLKFTLFRQENFPVMPDYKEFIANSEFYISSAVSYLNQLARFIEQNYRNGG